MEQKEEKSWLHRLQRESWEMELLVSGFVLIMLFQLPEVLDNALIYFSSNLPDQFHIIFISVIPLLFITLRIVAYVLIFHLVLHILSRAFWIGLIGLRSVFPKDYDIMKLKYNDLFKSKLKDRVPLIKDLILKLDKFTSLNFSFTFLLLCISASISLCVIHFSWITVLWNVLFGYKGMAATIPKYIWTVYFLTGALFTLIDFMSMGWLKRGKLGKVYYYVFYVFFKWVTLSFIYNSVYYTFITNVKKRHFVLLFLAYFIIFYFISLIPGVSPDTFFKPNESGLSYLDNRNYDDTNNEGYKRNIMIRSLTIDNDVLEIYLPVEIRELSTYRKLKGEGLDAEKLIDLFLERKQIFIDDSLYLGYDAFLTRYPENKQKAFLLILDISNLSKGKHILKVKNDKMNRNTFFRTWYGINKEIKMSVKLSEDSNEQKTKEANSGEEASKELNVSNRTSITQIPFYKVN